MIESLYDKEYLRNFTQTVFCGIKLYILCQIISKQEDQTHDVRHQSNAMVDSYIVVGTK